MDENETLHLLMLGCLQRADDTSMAIDTGPNREELATFLLTLGWTYDLSTLTKEKTS